jgi:hypothetical protein
MDTPPEQVAARRFPCPVHGGSDALSLRLGDDGRALLHCHAGTCSFADIADKLGIEHGTGPGVTLDALADYFRVPYQWLEEEGWEDATYYDNKTGDPIDRVAIPYFDHVEHEPVTRYRVSLDRTDKFRWSKGPPKAKPKEHGLLYRAEDLKACKDQGVLLVEGESDALILKRAGVGLAIGLPGASMWNEEAHAPQFADVSAIYVPLELDSGGSALLDALSASVVRDKVWIIALPGAKDVREFYASDPGTFAGRMSEVFKSVQTLADFGSVQRKLAADAALAEAGDIPKQSDRLTALLDTYEANGLVGERAIAAAATLVFVSAVGEKHTVSIIIKGGSSGGKSYAESEVRAHFPKSYAYHLSNASEKALYYLPPNTLKNRVLVLAEATGLETRKGEASGLAEAVRVLQSEGVLDYVTVIAVRGGAPQTHHVHQDGPTALLVTTTATEIHPENETRALSLSIDDRRDQTKKVMRSVASRFAGTTVPADKKQWHAWFEYLRLECIGKTVVIPFAPTLAELIDPVALRMRRDISTLLNFVSAHALLHFDLRERDDKGRIVATVEDYGKVREYLGDAFTEAVDSNVTDADRETVEAVVRLHQRLRDEGDLSFGVTISALGEELGLGRKAAERRLKHPLERGWIVNQQPVPRRPAQLAAGEPLPVATSALLPTVEQVLQRMIEDLK